ncbi:MAG: hypothetical protein HC830_12945, partial [Bacteroidetes bacterium]|nr:hypothetical protein [Bacteroidota bacterium]
SVTEYNNAPPPSRWWTYHENADQLVDFTTIKQYNGGDNRMGLALWSDGNCIPSTWGGTNPDFCQDRRSDYFPMRIRITIVAVAEGHTFSGWSNYGSGGGGGGGGNPDVTFSIDYQNERTSQNVPNYYQYSFNQTDWTTGSNAKVDLTPGQNVYFKKTETGDIQTLTVAGRPSAPSTGIDFTNETTTTNIGSTLEYSENSDLSGATQGNGSKVELTPGNDLYLRKKAPRVLSVQKFIT